MNTRTINTQLKGVYAKYAQYMNACNGDNPVLMQCKPAYAKEGNTRILFVIKEDDEEWFTVPSEAFDNNKIVETATSLYKNFKFSYPYDFLGIMMGTICKGINGNDSNNYLWTKFNPFGNYNKDKCQIPKYKCQMKAMDMLKEEIEICEPHAIVFIADFGGQSDLELIKHTIGRNIMYMPVKGIPSLSVVQGKKTFDIPMYRFSVYDYFQAGSFEIIADKLIQLIKSDVKVEEYSY